MNIFRKLSLFSATQLTAISFILTAIIGGTGIYFTEKDRVVIKEYPTIGQVLITQNQENDSEYLNHYNRTESHTFVKTEKTKGESYINSIFTATSAICVTGLVTTDFSQFSLPGQLIVLTLMQMGGLGIIVFTSFLAFAVFRGVSESISLKNLLSTVMDSDHNSVKDMLKYTILFTFLFESLATLIMGSYLEFFTDGTLTNGINPWWWSLFHSVSAFNNAGFSLMKNNLINYATDPVINIVIMMLIILGGIGYPVLIAGYLNFRRILMRRKNGVTNTQLQYDLSGVASKVQIKIAVIGTILLIVVGTIMFFFLENTGHLLDGYSIPAKIMISAFQSVTTRTAGFNTIDIGAINISTLLLMIGLMYVGTNPAGTGGGIKIPTIAVLYGYIKDWFDKPGQPVVILSRRISKFAISHAIRLFFFSIIFIGIVTFLISHDESEFMITSDPIFNLQKILFEVVSAFGTVGLSTGYTGSTLSLSALFSNYSKILIIITMFIGRIGPLTLLQALPWKHPDAIKPVSLDYEQSDKIQIG